ncbi:unnamed protein product [Rotaria sp. Silwood1]|nr:unnamed protein product [Rotaria sp. Silwood1]CAF1322953.1 unnamed protein product [Rotaria sp. Silwood1]
MSGHLSIGDRWRIISLSLDQGMTTNQIASVINCTSRTVRNILQLFRETNNVIEREERGLRLSEVSLSFVPKTIESGDLVGILFGMKIDSTILSTPFADVGDVITVFGKSI